MGLFDFLKPKPKPVPQEATDGPSPHYAFAHYAIRHIALAEPLQFLGVLASPKSADFLTAILQDTQEEVRQKANFSAADVKVHQARVGNFPCVVLELPEPAEMAEAFMAAFVVPIDLESGVKPNPVDITGRYFTLEKGFSMSGESRTVLAEWNSSSHLNYGDGPEPTVEAFVASLSKMFLEDDA